MSEFRYIMFMIGMALSLFWGYIMMVAAGWGGFGLGAANFFGYGFAILPASFVLGAIRPRRWLLAVLSVANLLSVFVAAYIAARETRVVGILLACCVVTWYVYAVKMIRGQNMPSHRTVESRADASSNGR